MTSVLTARPLTLGLRKNKIKVLSSHISPPDKKQKKTRREKAGGGGGVGGMQ